MVGLCLGEDMMMRWKESLRPLSPEMVRAGEKKVKPDWNVSMKQNSPAMQTNSEGGSLWTQRKMYVFDLSQTN